MKTNFKPSESPLRSTHTAHQLSPAFFKWRREVVLLAVVLFLAHALTAPISAAELFLQDFSSSSVVANYVNASPNNGQWNAISTSGGGVTIAITSGKLAYSTTGANGGSASRTAAFSGPPSVLIYKFELSTSGHSVAATSAGLFYVGNTSLGTANSAPTTANVRFRFSVNLTTTAGTFTLRDIAAGANSANLSGAQAITWVMNTSGATVSYRAPDGTQETLADSKQDIWAGTTKIFDDAAQATAGVSMQSIKFVITASSSGTINQDNIVIDPIPATPVSSSASTTTSGSFTANWSAASGATGYRLDVATDSAFTTLVSGFNNLDVGNVTSKAVTGLSANTAYWYRIRAYNSTAWGDNNVGQGANSGSQTLTTLVAAPAAPTANAATTVTGSGFTANWSTASGATSYRLDVSTVNTFASFVSGYQDLTVSGISQSVSGLSAGTTYYYRVRAVNAGGTSGNSSTITTITIPAAPSSSAATSVSSSGFTANWAASTGAAGYRLDVSTASDFSSFVSGYSDLDVANVLTYAVLGLNSSTTYHYRVRAYNTGGTSGSSSTIDAITDSAGCTPPTIDSTTPVNLTCNGSPDGSITVSASGGTGSIEYSKDNGANWQSGSAFTGLAAGTYQIKVRGSDLCASLATPITLTEPAALTITLGTSPTVCFGTTSANLPYSATTGTPNLYSVNFDTTAEGQGFVDVAFTTLPSSPIAITVPGSAAAGTYNGTLTVKTNSCISSSYAITVTISPASVGGSITPSSASFCGSGSTTLTLSGQTGNVTKWQFSSVSDFSSGVTDVANTTTTLTTPTLSSTTYYRAVILSGTCLSANSSVATLTVNTTPTITLGANPTVCSDSGTAPLTYSVTTGSPDKYSIVFDSAAHTAGFTDVTLANLPASPISITVPGSAAAATYNGTLTVKNNTTGCTSGGSAITVTVNRFSVPGATATIFSENMGTPSATTTIANYSTGTAPATFQNKGTLTYADGAQANPADVRITSLSDNAGASGNGNVFFTTTSGAYGFSIEGINAANYTSLTLSYGYRKESASVNATFSVEYWDGSAWQTVANTASALFNESASASIGWYAAKSLTLPAGAQINGLKIRFVKTGTASIRIDDVKLTGSPAVTSVSITPSGATTFCGSGTVTLTATAGGTSYLWSPGSATTAAISPTTSSTTTYTVVVTGANGCTASASQLVTINAIPSAPATTGGSSCGSGSVALSASGSGGTLKWYSNIGLTTQVATGTTYNTPTLNSTTTYYVTETSASGCISSAATVTATINPVPTTSAISGSALVQAGQVGVTYSVSLTSGSSYAWTVPSGASITAGSTGPNNNQITVTFGGTSGNVTATETSAAGCTGSQVSLAVSVNHSPVGAAKSLSTSTNKSATVSVNKLIAGATDVDGNTLSITAATASANPNSGTVVLNPGSPPFTSITYIPFTDYSGPDSFTFTLSDGHGGSDVVTVTVTVVDPSNPTSTGNGSNLAIRMEGSGVRLIIVGTAGKVYELQTSTDLNNWIPFTPAFVMPETGVTNFDDSISYNSVTNGARYYRTVLP